MSRTPLDRVTDAPGELCKLTTVSYTLQPELEEHSNVTPSAL